MVFISDCLQCSLNKIEWAQIYWPKCEQKVAELQKCIYLASQKKKKYKTYYYQKILVNLPEARLLAVCRVTTENKGKRTGGVDKQIITSAKEKIQLSKKLKIDGKATPIRRLWIPKPGKSELRPLGIPTIKDRAKQMLLKLALEPEWEAKFEPSSYGFRPGRSCQDAIEHIFAAARYNGKGIVSGMDKWVLDADLRGCYDNIDHKYLLDKLETTPQFRKQVSAWLKAGIFEGYLTTKEYESIPTNQKGTPQGGIISPLLANIALDGLEMHLKNWNEKLPDSSGKDYHPDRRRSQIMYVRYADDFVVIYKDKARIEQAKQVIEEWFKNNSKLEIAEGKTSIKPLSKGFSFLGFRIIAVKRNNQARAKIYPSKESQLRFQKKIHDIFSTRKASAQIDLIQKLAPVIIGWGNYYKYAECQDIFRRMDFILYNLIRSWAFRRHSSRIQAIKKYFPGNPTKWNGKIYEDRWVFKWKYINKKKEIQEYIIPKMSWISSSKFVKIKGTKSIYDGNYEYWLKRSKRFGPFTTRQKKLLVLQKHLCPICNTKINPFSTVEIDHIKGRSIKGAEKENNLQLVHIMCHKTKTKMEKNK